LRHLADELDDFLVVFEFINVALDLVDGLPLGHNEGLAVAHFLLDRFEKQVVTLLLLGLD